MTKVTLEFNLPEDKEDLKLAQSGPDYYAALVEFANFIRNKAKHESDNLVSWEAVKEEFWRIMNEYDVSIL